MKYQSDGKSGTLAGTMFLFLVGIVGWWIPGCGHWLIGRPGRAAMIFISITFAFAMGIWVGSIAVIDKDTPWFYAQILNSPMVAYLAYVSKSLGLVSYGRPREIGEIYTGIAGMLNLLCVVNAIYLAHCDSTKKQDK